MSVQNVKRKQLAGTWGTPSSIKNSFFLFLMICSNDMFPYITTFIINTLTGYDRRSHKDEFRQGSYLRNKFSKYFCNHWSSSRQIKNRHPGNPGGTSLSSEDGGTLICSMRCEESVKNCRMVRPVGPRIQVRECRNHFPGFDYSLVSGFVKHAPNFQSELTHL
ncbi:15604_t:CDS:2 [Acaulospora morrowiae]|uniref:15604_t:CDS:1 n=1 Tax=Acaulospora morrowiae TaxID=94023 RepID=A0A9N9FD58_9GLOM|nr:15604_t:CDS:2 [Acaulospora morrowiae]